MDRACCGGSYGFGRVMDRSCVGTRLGNGTDIQFEYRPKPIHLFWVMHFGLHFCHADNNRFPDYMVSYFMGQGEGEQNNKKGRQINVEGDVLQLWGKFRFGRGPASDDRGS